MLIGTGEQCSPSFLVFPSIFSGLLCSDTFFSFQSQLIQYFLQGGSESLTMYKGRSTPRLSDLKPDISRLRSTQKSYVCVDIHLVGCNHPVHDEPCPCFPWSSRTVTCGRPRTAVISHSMSQQINWVLVLPINRPGQDEFEKSKCYKENTLYTLVCVVNHLKSFQGLGSCFN